MTKLNPKRHAKVWLTIAVVLLVGYLATVALLIVQLKTLGLLPDVK